MAIPKAKYEDLKEYWDYQRKIAYNKELIFHMADKFQNRVYNDFGNVSIDELKNCYGQGLILVTMKNLEKVMYQQMRS